MTRAKKSLGQNFLTDERVVDRIIQSVSPQPRDLIVEIGPGRGALTRPLATECRFLLAVETDGELAETLEREIGSDRIRIAHGDALKIEWEEVIENAVQDFEKLDPEFAGQIRVRFVANLPYYISTPILQRLMELRTRICDMTLMLQEEVVDRISSGPGNRDYGYLSVLCQMYCDVEKLFKVPPSAFKPAPEVWSAIVRLQVRPAPLVVLDDDERFLLLVRCSFAQRRKTILNNLKAAGAVLSTKLRSCDSVFQIEPEAALNKAGIDSRRRAETLSIMDFAALYRATYGVAQQKDTT